jgi:D-sedoheptulose 7-phosphate isomerase
VAGAAARSAHDRGVANAEFFSAHAEALARLCDEMAVRFLAGGRLLALGVSGPARSDAHHVAVEFVHPVIVGKRALPALAVEDLGEAEPGDIVIAFDGDASVARELGCLMIEGFEPPVADPFIRQELTETLYHVLWELVHVFIEHRERRGHDAGASSFLYPFLGGSAQSLESVVEDVRRSILAKAEEVGALRWPPPRTRCARRRACSRWATAGRRRTPWTSWRTCARGGGGRWI